MTPANLRGNSSGSVTRCNCLYGLERTPRARSGASAPGPAESAAGFRTGGSASGSASVSLAAERWFRARLGCSGEHGPGLGTPGGGGLPRGGDEGITAPG